MGWWTDWSGPVHVSPNVPQMTIRKILNMRFSAFGLLGLALPVMAMGQTPPELEGPFMAACTDAGNEAADCTCIVQNWAKDLSADDLPLAIAAVEMSYQTKVPDPNVVQQVMPLIMSMMDYTMLCAAGELTASGLTEHTEIPQTGDATEAALLLERLTRGDATVAEMMRYDQLIASEREDTKQAERAEQDAADARAATARAALRDSYEAELKRIHSRPIPEWHIAEFERLFDLYCRMGGGTDAACDCGWDKVAALSRSYALPYLASRSEGDDVFERLSQADVYGTIPALSLLNEQRAECDGL